MKKPAQHFFRLKNLDTLKSTLLLSDLTEELQNHIRALRIKPNEHLKFSDGSGNWMIYVCESKETFKLLSQGFQEKPKVQISLLLSPPKGDALWDTLSHATQMGVSEIVLFRSDFCQQSPEQLGSSSFKDRSERIIQASCLSCERNWDLNFKVESSGVSDLVQNLTKSRDPSSYIILFADESMSSLGYWGIQNPEALGEINQIYVLVGPEGGFSEKERILLSHTSRTTQLGLGPNVLRVPTATVSALTFAQFYLSRFN